MSCPAKLNISNHSNIKGYYCFKNKINNFSYQQHQHYFHDFQVRFNISLNCFYRNHLQLSKSKQLIFKILKHVLF